MADAGIIQTLQNQIMRLQKGARVAEPQNPLGLGEIEHVFPDQVFPRAAVHEFISYTPENASSTNGFLAVLLGKLMQQGGTGLWISKHRRIFPPAIKSFGIDPDRVIFVDLSKTKDVLWSLEECLKCSAVKAVVGELNELSFNESRRLQLAVERSRVTGLIHRYVPKTENPVACVSRWKISTLASEAIDEMPGLGFPRWQVQLSKVRNGQTGEWQVQWSPQGLLFDEINAAVTEKPELKTG